MRLKCELERVDFVPMVKTPRFWMSKKTLKKDSILDVEPEIGHQLLAAYPGAFRVESYEDKKPERKKKVSEESLTHGESAGDFVVHVPE